MADGELASLEKKFISRLKSVVNAAGSAGLNFNDVDRHFTEQWSEKAQTFVTKLGYIRLLGYMKDKDVFVFEGQGPTMKVRVKAEEHTKLNVELIDHKKEDPKKNNYGHGRESARDFSRASSARPTPKSTPFGSTSSFNANTVPLGKGSPFDRPTPTPSVASSRPEPTPTPSQAPSRASPAPPPPPRAQAPSTSAAQQRGESAGPETQRAGNYLAEDEMPRFPAPEHREQPRQVQHADPASLNANFKEYSAQALRSVCEELRLFLDALLGFADQGGLSRLDLAALLQRHGLNDVLNESGVRRLLAHFGGVRTYWEGSALLFDEADLDRRSKDAKSVDVEGQVSRQLKYGDGSARSQRSDRQVPCMFLGMDEGGTAVLRRVEDQRPYARMQSLLSCVFEELLADEQLAEQELLRVPLVDYPVACRQDSLFYRGMITGVSEDMRKIEVYLVDEGAFVDLQSSADLFELPAGFLAQPAFALPFRPANGHEFTPNPMQQVVVDLTEYTYDQGLQVFQGSWYKTSTPN